MNHELKSNSVSVKKINLEVWTLKEEIREEIRHVLKEKIQKESGETAQINAIDRISDQELGEISSRYQVNSQNQLKLVESLKPTKVYKGNCFLSEINMTKLHLFCSQSFIEGQSIVIKFDIPKPFIINTEVISCRNFAKNSRIISDNKLPYRIIAKFTFLKPGERALLRNFLGEIDSMNNFKLKPKLLAEVSDDNEENPPQNTNEEPLEKIQAKETGQEKINQDGSSQ